MRGGNGHTIKGDKAGLTQETLYKIAAGLALFRLHPQKRTYHLHF